MTPQMIVSLIIALGPTALDLIQKLAAIWSKPSLTVDEVVALCAPAKKSYDEYIAEAKAALIPQDAVTTAASVVVGVACAPDCACNAPALTVVEAPPAATEPPCAAPEVAPPQAAPI